LTRPISRRAVLLGGLSAGASFILAACGAAAPTPSRLPSQSPASSGGGASSSPTPSATPTAASTPSPTPGPSLESKIARLLIVGFRGLTVETAGPVVKAIAEDGLGGVILFSRDQLTGGARNIESPKQLTKLVADLRALAPDRTLLVAVDQEGGRVARLSPATGFPAFAGEHEIATKGDKAIEAWARSIATTLASVGINLNLAPVVDLDVNPDNPAIGALGRSFSADPAAVTRDATTEVRAHRDAGVRTALKHFPGLGSASTNTDFGVADVTKTWSPTELGPYRAMIAAGDVDLIMVGNLVNGRSRPRCAGIPLRADGHRPAPGPARLGWGRRHRRPRGRRHHRLFGADDAIRLALAPGTTSCSSRTSRPTTRISRRTSWRSSPASSATGRSARRIDESYARVVAFAGSRRRPASRPRERLVDRSGRRRRPATGSPEMEVIGVHRLPLLREPRRESAVDVGREPMRMSRIGASRSAPRRPRTRSRQSGTSSSEAAIPRPVWTTDTGTSPMWSSRTSAGPHSSASRRRFASAARASPAGSTRQRSGASSTRT
jgi:beta-N-acetylhexosaminidase